MRVTRSGIITAAMKLIEAEGVHAASMTRLATELGCGLLPLYRQVPSMAALLDGIEARVMSGIELTTAPDGDWRDELRAQARAFRAAAAAYPRCAILVAGRPPASAATLRAAEHVLASLRSAGLSGQDAVRIVRVAAAFLAGSLLCEVGVAPSLRDDGDGELRRRPAQLSGTNPDTDFELGLDLLVCGLDALASAGNAGPGRDRD
ncbi:MAG: TetR/AcrR family transcriptional regulator C-terminal domain-containing protein [Actinobacteria bacterium]|nr:TetR/AcrR family transcriptional regulator C-terminal domain-containing protein [Actinomycetota bacterium]